MPTQTAPAPAFKAEVTVSDTKLIAEHLLTGLSAREKATEIKALTPVDRAQLGCGLRNGSWTYDD